MRGFFVETTSTGAGFGRAFMPGIPSPLISLAIPGSLKSGSARFGVLRHFAPHDARMNTRHSARLTTVPAPAGGVFLDRSKAQRSEP
jgi:hypothetical protein